MEFPAMNLETLAGDPLVTVWRNAGLSRTELRDDLTGRYLTNSEGPSWCRGPLGER